MSEDRCVICGEVIPEGTMVCPLCAGSEHNPVTPEFICARLGDLFGYPCSFSPQEEELHDTEEKCEWCERNCGKASAADCWMHYFHIKHKEGDRK